jgi:hypothetical protein
MIWPFYRTLRTAVRALRRNVMRSLLTCLAIISASRRSSRWWRSARDHRSVAVTAVLHWPTSASLGAIVASVGVSAGVGNVFGYYPMEGIHGSIRSRRFATNNDGD